VKGIAAEAGLTRYKVEGVLNRTGGWKLIAEQSRGARERLKAGQKKGAQTKVAAMLERIINAGRKDQPSLRKFAEDAGISFQWLNKMRQKNVIVDALALGVIAKNRPLSPGEKARLAAGRVALLKRLQAERSAEKQAELRRIGAKEWANEI